MKDEIRILEKTHSDRVLPSGVKNIFYIILFHFALDQTIIYFFLKIWNLCIIELAWYMISAQALNCCALFPLYSVMCIDYCATLHVVFIKIAQGLIKTTINLYTFLYLVSWENDRNVSHPWTVMCPVRRMCWIPTLDKWKEGNTAIHFSAVPRPHHTDPCPRRKIRTSYYIRLCMGENRAPPHRSLLRQQRREKSQRGFSSAQGSADENVADICTLCTGKYCWKTILKQLSSNIVKNVRANCYCPSLLSTHSMSKCHVTLLHKERAKRKICIREY